MVRWHRCSLILKPLCTIKHRTCPRTVESYREVGRAFDNSRVVLVFRICVTVATSFERRLGKGLLVHDL